jgi:hypothetical protein
MPCDKHSDCLDCAAHDALQYEMVLRAAAEQCRHNARDCEASEEFDCGAAHTADACSIESLSRPDSKRAYDAAIETVTMKEHANHVQFESDLYCTLVDPCAEGSIKEAELHAAVLEAARFSRQHIFDLETQLTAANAALDALQESQGSSEERAFRKALNTPAEVEKPAVP